VTLSEVNVQARSLEVKGGMGMCGSVDHPTTPFHALRVALKGAIILYGTWGSKKAGGSHAKPHLSQTLLVKRIIEIHEVYPLKKTTTKLHLMPINT